MDASGRGGRGLGVGRARLAEVSVRQQRGWRRQLVPGSGPLATVPPLLVFLVVAAVFAAGVLAGGALGAVLLGALAVFVAVLLAVAWPRLGPPDRALRLVVLLALVAVALLQLR